MITMSTWKERLEDFHALKGRLKGAPLGAAEALMQDEIETLEEIYTDRLNGIETVLGLLVEIHKRKGLS